MDVRGGSSSGTEGGTAGLLSSALREVGTMGPAAEVPRTLSSRVLTVTSQITLRPSERAASRNGWLRRERSAHALLASERCPHASKGHAPEPQGGAGGAEPPEP